MKRASTVPRPALLLAALLCGCTNSVNITSAPSGARVWIDGEERGLTPLTTDVEWSTLRYNRITLDHPDCRPLNTKLPRGFRYPRPLEMPPEETYTSPEQEYFAKVRRGFSTIGPGLLIYSTIGLGAFAFRGPMEDQRFVLAPRAHGEGDGDRTPRDVVIYEDLFTWSLGIGGGYYVSGWDQPTFGGALELRFGNEALRFSGGPGERVECEAIPGGEWHIGEGARYVYRRYMGTASRSLEWFLEIGTKDYGLEFEEAGGPSPLDTSSGTVRHLAAGAGVSYTWLRGSPSCYSEFYVTASNGDELRPPDGSASSDIRVDRTQATVGIILIGLTF